MSPFTFLMPGQPHASTSAPRPVPGTSQSITPPLEGEASSGNHVPRLAKDAELARMKTWVAESLDMLQTAMSIAAEIADNNEFPSLSIGLESLVEVLRKLETMQTMVEGVETLKESVRFLLTRLEDLRQHCDGRKLPDGMRPRIEELAKSWQDIRERAAFIKSHGTLRRFLTKNKDARALGYLVGEIGNSILDRIATQGILSIENYETRRAVKATKASLPLTFIPRYAKMAPYYANETRRSCLEGTRVEFLQEIYSWITAACERGEAIPGGGIVLWINGLGGTGKTTVARSVAEWSDHRKVLGGSFFCSRSDQDCSDPSLVFPTLCRQLCEHHQPFKDKVQEVLERDPNTASYGLYRQFEELIVRPLEALKSPFPRSVYVFDALDELKDKGLSSAKSTILSVIAKFVPRIAKFLLFVITSRPEADITALFEAKRRDSLKDTTTPLLLRNIPIDIALRDIKLYIDYEFEENVGFLGVEPDWPSAEEKNVLAEQSQGLFIYVATAIKFIMDKTHRDPKGQMDLLPAPKAKPLAPHEVLFSLYTTILVASYEKVSPDSAARLRDVLSAVVLAQEALSPLSVARLVGLDVTMVRSTLTGLHSVLHVPTDDRELIRIIHPTFPEFLLSPEAAPLNSPNTPPAPSHLHLDPAEHHWYLFSRCVEVMSATLKRDIIGVRYPAMFQSEVDNLSQRVNTAIKPHVSYSCRFWGNHLRDGIEGGAELDVLQLFYSFVHGQLLYWIEACSWLDAVDKVILALDVAREVFQALGGRFTDLAPFLADCRRFVATYSPCIHAAPLQLYHSALGIAPITSPVRSQYSHERKHALVVEHGASANWAPCLDTIAGNALAVAFSPDGSYFVTGGENGKATIRKTATRMLVLSFDRHTDWVRGVVFSPDGLHVASGGDDRKVYVWKVLSGEPIHTLEGHSAGIYSVAYSADGRRFLSATRQGEVKLWDTTDGRCLFTLDKTHNLTLQVGISSDGGVIARGDKALLCLYDVSATTDQPLSRLPDEVQACSFSPDGCYIAARSERVIQVWAWPTYSLVRSIDVPHNLHGRLAFSHDSSLIGCGSEDGTVRLWSVTSQDPPCILQGHTDAVNAIAWNSSGSLMVSVAEDNMIRVWDGTLSINPAVEHAALEYALPFTQGPPRFALIWSGYKAISLIDLSAVGIEAECFARDFPTHTSALTARLFSDATSAWHAGLQAVNGQYRDSTHIWAPLVGQQHNRLSGRPLAISPDGSLMAYPSPASDRIANICDFRTGRVIATLTGHTGSLLSLAFSPDNTRLATGSTDTAVKVWDASTGTPVSGHTDHLKWPRDVIFSLNGHLVASGSDDRTVRIFEVSNERVICALDTHRDGVLHVIFAADNVHLVALDRADWVYVWDINAAALIREFSMQDHNCLRSPVFSPDDTGILVSGEDGAMRAASLWKPGARTWPAYHMTRDGWVYMMSPAETRRVGWLPPEWRMVLWCDGDRLIIGGTKWVENGRRSLGIFDMSRIRGYIERLDLECYQ